MTRARDTAAMFAMVSRDYHNYMTEENEIKHHMETTIGQSISGNVSNKGNSGHIQ